jgi:hypothetical protein
LEAKIAYEKNDKRVYKTPETPRFKIVRPENDEDKIEPNSQSMYRSVLGILLYLILNLICAILLGDVYGQGKNGYFTLTS